MRHASLLHSLYHNPETGYVGPDKLWKKARELEPPIKLKEVREWFANQPGIQEFQERRPRGLPSFNIASANPNSWQIDLTFYSHPLAEGSPTVILTAVNINSTIGYARRLNSKHAKSVLGGLQLFNRKHSPEIITSDNGREFMNKSVQEFFKKEGIRHFNNEAGDHNTMGKIERFNRTLKQRLVLSGLEPNQRNLDKLIDNYNDTEHSALRATPNEMRGEVINRELMENRESHNDLGNLFAVGNSVVYKLEKKTFAKESTRWSKSVYEVVGIDGYKVQIRSKNGHTLYKAARDLKKVNFMPTEVSHVGKRGQIYEVERILAHEHMRNGKMRYLVKWKGYDEPTLEPQDNLRLINKLEMSTAEKNYWRKN